MTGPLGIIAGKGQLPTQVADSALLSGRKVFLVRIDGLTDSVLVAYRGADFNIGAVGAVVARLRAEGCEEIVFAGYITRPDIANICFDEVGQSLLPKVMAATPQGDNAMMNVFISAFEDMGFCVLGAEDIYSDLLCSPGLLTQAAPSPAGLKDLDEAFRIAALIGREDIGQGCVVCDGLVLAVEAQEGTDAMLSRVSELDSSFRGRADERRGVFVKRTKPGQERRVDLPAIGVQTITLAAKAGLSGIGLEASGSLIIDQQATIEEANQAGLFIIGVELE